MFIWTKVTRPVKRIQTLDSLFDKLSYVPQVLRLMTTRYVNKFSLAAKHNHS